MDCIHFLLRQQIWELDAIRSWPRWRQNVWNVLLMISWSAEQIQIHHHTILDLTHQVLPTSQEKQWNVPAKKLKGHIFNKAAEMMEVADTDTLEFDGKKVRDAESGKEVSLVDIATASMCNNNETFQVTETNSSPVSPPPFMVGMVEIELDKETGHIEILDYVAVVDCGTPVNPNLARVQVEGGLGQGIGMALYEGVDYTPNGYVKQNSFMQYKVPARVDVGKLRVEFESSYEPTGPFGAKSIGEIVINTPSPALAHAVFNATGLWIRELPITSEKIVMGLLEKE